MITGAAGTKRTAAWPAGRGFFIGVILLLALSAGCKMSDPRTKIYRYSIDVGAAKEYAVLYDFDENYFTDRQDKPMVRFTAVGGSPASDWADGDQGTSISERNPLPTGIKVRWFSVAEDQFWQGYHRFDQGLLHFLSQYQVKDTLRNSTVRFADYFKFYVYVVPGGLVTVWVSCGSEKYLLAQFQADKVDEPDWATFSRRALHRQKPISRTDYIQERFNAKHSLMSTVAKQQLQAGTLPTDSAPWKRRMYSYYWQLTVNPEFELKDYLARYVNGEKRYTYHTQDQSGLPPRTVPYVIYFYIANRQTGELNHLRIEFDEEQMMQCFEQYQQLTDDRLPARLHFDINPQLTKLNSYLLAGDTKLPLKAKRVALMDLY